MSGRRVAIIAHIDHGKTSLTAAIAALSAKACPPMTSPTLSERKMEADEIVAEIEKLLPDVTAGPWKVYDGCSWRRIGTARSMGRYDDRAVLAPTIASDGHPDLTCSSGNDRDANLDWIALLNPANVRTLLADLAKAMSAPEAIPDDAMEVTGSAHDEVDVFYPAFPAPPIEWFAWLKSFANEEGVIERLRVSTVARRLSAISKAESASLASEIEELKRERDEAVVARDVATETLNDATRLYAAERALADLSREAGEVVEPFAALADQLPPSRTGPVLGYNDVLMSAEQFRAARAFRDKLRSRRDA